MSVRNVVAFLKIHNKNIGYIASYILSGGYEANYLTFDHETNYLLRALVQVLRKSCLSFTPNATRFTLPNLAKASPILSRNAFSSFVCGPSASSPTKVSTLLALSSVKESKKFV